MKANEVLNRVKELLGMEVKLATMKLSDGVTILEAEVFEAGAEVFIVAEDGQKIPLPVGEYELEDGRMLEVQQEGIIAEVKEAAAQEEEMPMEQPTAEVPVEAEAETTPAAKKVVESTVKETYFSEMEELKKENEELKAKLQELSKVEETETTETETTENEVELNEVKPITFNPENTNTIEDVKFAQNRADSTLDRILSRLNK